MPNLLHVKVFFLSKNTTSRLQPLDTGIIASIKTRYRKAFRIRAVDLLSLHVSEVYATDVFQVMENVFDM